MEEELGAMELVARQALEAEDFGKLGRLVVVLAREVRELAIEVGELRAESIELKRTVHWLSECDTWKD